MATTAETVLEDLDKGVGVVRQIVDEAAALGLLPEARLVQPIVDGLARLLDDVQKWQRGELTPIQVAVEAADAAAVVAGDARFPAPK